MTDSYGDQTVDRSKSVRLPTNNYAVMSIQKCRKHGSSGMRRYSSLVLQAAVILCISCVVANAKQLSPSNKLLLKISSDNDMIDTTTRINTLSKVNDIRAVGGLIKVKRESNKPISTNTNDVSNSSTSNSYYLGVDVNTTPQTKQSAILSMILLIIDQTINLSGAAFVTSGYFGAFMASYMISKLHQIIPTFTSSNGLLGSIINNDAISIQYKIHTNVILPRLTSLTTIGMLLLNIIPGIQMNNSFGRLSDISFITILWAFSKRVDPIMGGLIGFTHLTISIISNILGNRRLINSLDHLQDVRLKSLSNELREYEDYVDPTKKERVSREPIIIAGSGESWNTKFTLLISKVMNSTSFLLVWPQLFLGLYTLLGCFTDVSGMGIRMLSNRLVALYWGVALVKMVLHLVRP